MHIVSLVPLGPSDQERIRAIDPSVTLTMAPGWFDGELRQSWGDHTADGYLRPGSNGQGTRAERDALLAPAEVIIGGFPLPVDLRRRAPELRWVHQTPAGASNLHPCDLWGSDVIVTTSRGLGNTLAIAEYVIAAFLHFARDLHRAAGGARSGALDRSIYRPTLLAGQTACVIGAGGIGQEVGRLANALGLHVVGTRRSVNGPPPPGFDDVAPPERLHDLLSRSRFVAVCCQWTPETENLISHEALAALPEGAVLVNVARGEIIDEEALVANLDRLRGVALDVYVGEFDGPPRSPLADHPRVLVTPHVSAGAEQRSSRPVDLFCRNLAALLAGRELENEVDWARGY